MSERARTPMWRRVVAFLTLEAFLLAQGTMIMAATPLPDGATTGVTVGLEASGEIASGSGDEAMSTAEESDAVAVETSSGLETDNSAARGEAHTEPRPPRRRDLPRRSASTVVPEKSARVSLGDVVLEIPAGAVAEPTEISITRLDRVEDLDPSMFNVTAGGSGYRFQPHGMEFLEPVLVTVPFEARRVASAGERANLYTYYYDEQSELWQRLERVEVDEEGGTISSRTTHFTDMITSTLKLPQSPDPLRFNPTAIKDIKAANPTAGVPELEGLEPSSFGSAGFRIPLRLPPGRQNMQPRVAFSYDSDDDNSWMGVGFDLRVSTIAVDTRFGVPGYEGEEVYLLDGKQLVAVDEGEDERTYRPRRESRFREIRRNGSGPVSYTFEVTETDGTTSYYGSVDAWEGTPDGNKFKFFLKQRIDANGNTATYYYDNDRDTENHTYLSAIRYTGYLNSPGARSEGGDAGAYEVRFERTDRDDKRISARGGYYSKLAERLEHVTVSYDEEPFRRYRITYADEANGGPDWSLFGHSKVISIAEQGGSAGDWETLWEYGFDYHRMPTGDNGEFLAFPEDEAWSFNGVDRDMGRTDSLSFGANVYFGAGPLSVYEASGGAKVSWQNSNNFDRALFMDMTGDGLPDLVRQQNPKGNLDVRVNRGRSGFSEGEEFNVDELVNQETSNSFNFSGTYGAGSVGLSAGGGVQFTRAKSTLTDIDGDGYVDFVPERNARTWERNDDGRGFVRTDWTVSEQTVDAGADSGASSMQKRDDFDEAYHLIDAVRMWRPYRSGTIRIDGNVDKKDTGDPGSADYRPGDGVQVNLYKNSESLWSDIDNTGQWSENVPSYELSTSALLKNENGYRTHQHSDRVAVEPSDRLYFRVRSIDGVYNDAVRWNPEVVYETIDLYEDMWAFDSAYVPPSLSPQEGGALGFSPYGGEGNARVRDSYEAIWGDTDGDGDLDAVVRYDLSKSFSDFGRSRRNSLRLFFLGHGYVVPVRIAAGRFEAFYNGLPAPNRETASNPAEARDEARERKVLLGDGEAGHYSAAYRKRPEEDFYELVPAGHANDSEARRAVYEVFEEREFNQEAGEWVRFPYNGARLAVVEDSAGGYSATPPAPPVDVDQNRIDVWAGPEAGDIGAVTDRGILFEIEETEDGTVRRWLDDGPSGLVLHEVGDGSDISASPEALGYSVSNGGSTTVLSAGDGRASRSATIVEAEEPPQRIATEVYRDPATYVGLYWDQSPGPVSDRDFRALQRAADDEAVADALGATYSFDSAAQGWVPVADPDGATGQTVIDYLGGFDSAAASAYEDEFRLLAFSEQVPAEIEPDDFETSILPDAEGVSPAIGDVVEAAYDPVYVDPVPLDHYKLTNALLADTTRQVELAEAFVAMGRAAAPAEDTEAEWVAVFEAEVPTEFGPAAFEDSLLPEAEAVSVETKETVQTAYEGVEVSPVPVDHYALVPEVLSDSVRQIELAEAFADIGRADDPAFAAPEMVFLYEVIDEYAELLPVDDGPDADENTDNELAAVLSELQSVGLYNYASLSRSLSVYSGGTYDVTREDTYSGAAERRVQGDDAGDTAEPSATSFILTTDFDARGRLVHPRQYVHVFQPESDFSLTDLSQPSIEEPAPDPGDYAVSEDESEAENQKDAQEGAMADIPEEAFRGGVYNWFYGEWNSTKAHTREGPGAEEVSWNPEKIGARAPHEKTWHYFRGMRPLEAGTTTHDAEDYRIDIENPLGRPLWQGTETRYTKRDYDDAGTLVEEEHWFSSYIAGAEMAPSRVGGDAKQQAPSSTREIKLGGIGDIRESWGWSANGGVSVVSGMYGESYGVIDLMDLNGDRYPDQLILPKKGSRKILWNAGGGFDGSTGVSGLSGFLRKSQNGSASVGVTQGGSGEPREVEANADGEIVKFVPGSNYGLGVNASLGSGQTVADFVDLTGDGLPDHVTAAEGDFDVSINLGDGSFRSDGNWSADHFGSRMLHSVVEKLSLGSNVVTYRNTVDAGYNVSVGKAGLSGNVSVSMSGNRTKVAMMDINGDGLADRVSKVNDEEFFRIRLNLGDRFSSEELHWHAGAWSRDLDNVWLDNLETLRDDLVDGISAKFGVSTEAVDWELLSTGLVKPGGYIVASAINANDLNPYGPGDVLSFQGGFQASLGLDYLIPIPIPIPFTPFLSLWIKPGVNIGYSVRDAQLQMTDIDGDGLPDHVLKWRDDQELRVKLNRGAKVGLLTHIETPTGGTVAIDYEREGNTKDMPQSRWVMAEVTRDDGMGELLEQELGATDPEVVGYHRYTTTHSYENGKYSREERMFYGFDRVVTTHPDGSITERSYYNGTPGNKGLLRRSVLADDNGPTYRERERRHSFEVVETALDGSAQSVWPRLDREITRRHDTDSEEMLETATAYESYDRYGNPKVVIDEADTTTTGDDIVIEIEYHRDLNDYIVSKPSRLVVKEHGGPVLRERSGDYDGSGNLIEHTQVYSGSMPHGNPTTTFSHDEYGNIETVTGPRGYTVSYRYEDELYTYVDRISDSEGYVSRARYDYRFGRETTTTGIGGATMEKSYDRHGRLSTVRSPYDTGAVPALLMDYRLDAFPAYAVSANKILHDPGDEQVMRTSVVVDGLRRVAQTKSDGEVYDTHTGENIVGMTVSGRVLYDEKGREWKRGQPGFEPQGGGAWAGPIALGHPRTTAYDILDRPVSTTHRDGSITERRYHVSSAGTRREVEDAEEGRRREERNARGHITAVSRWHAEEQQWITTSYAYTLLGEMTAVTDDEGNTTTVGYDTLGRREYLHNPDRGLIEYSYDIGGNLTGKLDGKTRGLDHGIRYRYDEANRLSEIEYPKKQNVGYTYGDADAGFDAGRLIRVESEAGVSEYEYGKLGERIGERRRLHTLLGTAGDRIFETSYRYDYLGRMQEITYPDGERVEYSYDVGGKITEVSGVHSGTTFSYIKDIGYDEFGQRVYIRYGNDTETTYRYDAERRWLSGITTESPVSGVAGGRLQELTYEFDLVGNVESVVNDGEVGYTSQEYSYDSLYRLTGAEGVWEDRTTSVNYRRSYSQRYSYDTIGNMSEKRSTARHEPSGTRPRGLNYSHDYVYAGAGPHQATAIGEWAYRYDANGNVTQRLSRDAAAAGGGGESTDPGDPLWDPPDVTETLGPDSGSAGEGFGRRRRSDSDGGEETETTYAWDEENRLTRATVGGATTRFLYDHNGIRTLKSGPEQESIYASELYQIQTRPNDDWTTKHIFVGETRVVSKVGIVTKDIPYEKQNTYFYHGDHLGSSNYVTDPDGRVYEQLEYTPWGEVWVDHASANLAAGDSLGKVDWTFTSKEYDPETGLYSFPARYYEPQTSRWMSVDPALGEYISRRGQAPGELAGRGGVFKHTNLAVYGYGGNNPIRFVDPNGLWIENSDGTHTAETGDTLWGLYGDDWREKSGYEGDPRELQPGDTVGVPDEQDIDGENGRSDDDTAVATEPDGGRSGLLSPREERQPDPSHERLQRGYEAFAGMETISLGGLLFGGGGTAASSGTVAGLIGGGFWMVVGGGIITVGVDIFAGDKWNPVDAVLDWFAGRDHHKE